MKILQNTQSNQFISIAKISLNRQNKDILGDSMMIGYSGISSAQNTNKLYLGYISDSTQYQEGIKVCVYSHTYICEYLNIYIYAYPHMTNHEIAKECGLALLGIMTDCKNLFLQELFLRFVECKNFSVQELFLRLPLTTEL